MLLTLWLTPSPSPSDAIMLASAYSLLGTGYVTPPPAPAGAAGPDGKEAPPPPPPRSPPASYKSAFNPFVLPLRAPTASAFAIKAKLWALLNTKTWYSQPLRLVVSNIHQYIYGYTALLPPPDALLQQATTTADAQASSAAEPSPLHKQIKDLKGLKDAYVAVLELRAEGEWAQIEATAVCEGM